MTKYLLPCACGKSTAVDLAQAGESIACECGAQLVAPTMRGLKSLPVAPDTTLKRPARVWGPGQGLSLLGLAVLLAGLSIVVYFYASQPTLHLDQIPARFASLAPVDTWRVWEVLQGGLPGPHTLETVIILHGAQSRQQTFAVGCVVAALGAIIAAIGVSYILAYTPRRGNAS